MDTIQKSAKTVDEAVSEALRALGASKDEVEITIIEAGSKGFMGFGAKPAVVSVTRKYDPVHIAKKFIKEMGIAMNIVINVDAEVKDKQLIIKLSGENMGVLIGKRGQTLDSIQYLVNLVVNKGNAPYLGVTVDTENYRERRKETLESLAHNLAKKVKATKKSVRLEPMNPFERRIIHATLQNDKFVVTHSEGAEPFRNVVITLKK